MSDEHDHSQHGHSHDHHDHGHDHGHKPAPETPSTMEDASSQALSEALRSSFVIVQVIMVVLFIVFLGSGFFKVKEGERAVRLHFGKPVGEGDKALLGPGLHWSWPYPIDEVVKIPYSQNQTVVSTAGWFRQTAEEAALQREAPALPALRPGDQDYVVTGDQNIIHARATVQYHIDDPIQYQFGFTNASKAVQDALDNALVFAAAQFNVDDILNRDVDRFQDAVDKRLVELAQQENLGIEVVSCQVSERVPPGYLKPQFEAVGAAASARDNNIISAHKYEIQAVSSAQSQAAALTNNAQAERETLVKSVQAEAQQFADVLPRYNNNPALLRNILWSETVSHIFTNLSERIYFVPQRADGEKRELRLELNREPLSRQQPKPAASPGVPVP